MSDMAKIDSDFLKKAIFEKIWSNFVHCKIWHSPFHFIIFYLFIITWHMDSYNKQYTF